MATLVAACVAGGAAAHARAATTICVGGGNGCYQALQPAFDAAHNGDTIKIAPGTYDGGVTVDASVKIVGAGAGKTIIKGGGPVLTIGKHEADADKLNVSISGVTVTGGVSTGVPSDPNAPPNVAGGGGIEIPSSQDTVGATVTIRDSVITGNRATPTSTEDSGEPCPGGVDCPSAQGFGGGIDEVGRLTLIDTVVSDNVAGGGVASNAAGGGISTATNGGPGALTLINSTVTGNKATATAPNGRFAEGGGIEVQDGEAFVVRDSTVSNNVASVSNTYPEDVDMLVDSAGIHVGGFGTATIEGTRITGNTASADDPGTTVGAIDAALAVGALDCPCGQTLDLRNSLISNNHAITNAASTDNGPDGTAVEIDSQATVNDTRIDDNTATVTTQGSAGALGAFLAFDNDQGSIVVSDSAIDGNTVMTSSSTGPATIQGGGLTNGGSLALSNVEIKGNSADAEGNSGFAQGGGLWNGQPLGPSSPQLTLDNTSVTKNVLVGSAGVALQGGGLFSLGSPFTLTNSRIEQNVPDQCFGC